MLKVYICKTMSEKKEYILKNVGELYMRFGIKSVTMDDVAREFGISKKTLYQYFKDKEELVSQVVEYYLAHPAFKLEVDCGGNAIDRYFAIRRHILHILKHFNNNVEYDLKRLYPSLYERLHEKKREKIYENTVSSLKDGMDQGMFREKLDVDFIARLQVGRMLYTLNPENRIFSEVELSTIDLYDKVIEYHMYAVCTPEGLDYFKKQLNKIKNEQ